MADSHFSINPSDAQLAFQQLAGKRAEISHLAPLPLVSSPQSVLSVLGPISEFIAKPEERSRFAALPDFDLFAVDNLYKMGMALWFASVKLREARSGESDARIGAGVKATAEETKARMFSLIEYRLAGDPGVVRQLNDIRPGSGYADLASDLVRLAGLHEQHTAQLEQDDLNYRQTDPEVARTLATRIMAETTRLQNEPNEWSEAASLSATLLISSYEHLRSAAGWIYSREPENLARFVAIRGLSRNGKRKAPAQTVEPPPFDKELTEDAGVA